jgi:hypothetical protein
MNFLPLASKMTHFSPLTSTASTKKELTLLTLQAANVANLLPQTADNYPN